MAKDSSGIVKGGVAFTLLLSVLWVATIALPWNWLGSANAVVAFEVNLWEVYTHAGTTVWMADLLSQQNSLSEAVKEYKGGHMTVAEAKEEFCSLKIFDWCPMWTQVYSACWTMRLTGILTPVVFLAGGVSFAFYAFFNATPAGRTLTIALLIFAPLCSIFGMVAFTALTMDFGKGESKIGVIASNGSKQYWGYGYYFGATITLLSWIPSYILCRYCNVDSAKNMNGTEDDSVAPTSTMTEDIKALVRIETQKKLAQVRAAAHGAYYGSCGNQEQPPAAAAAAPESYEAQAQWQQQSTSFHGPPQPQAGNEQFGVAAVPYMQGPSQSFQQPYHGIQQPYYDNGMQQQSFGQHPAAQGGYTAAW